MLKQVNQDYYNFKNYISKPVWSSYYHQIEEVLNSKKEKILIIGVGDGIVPNVLKKEGKRIITFDFAADLEPDYLGNILEIEKIIKNKFECILCCEVLEHLPFKYFEKIISKLENLTEKYCIISLPQQNLNIEISIKIPKIPKFQRTISIPKFYKSFTFEKDGNGEHYWELNVKNYPVSRIRKILEKYFILKNEYTVKENPYHRFFILEKKK